MPLQDHFHPPGEYDLGPDSLHASWAVEIMGRLNAHWLLSPFRARVNVHSGSKLDIDAMGQESATRPEVWSPASGSVPLVLPDGYEVQVFDGPSGWYLVGAVELVSRSNKKSPEERRAFVTKCASLLHAGVSVVVFDVVTDRHANLHNALLDYLGIASVRLPDEVFLYASAYRPARRGGRPELDVWAEPCQVGAELPTMPLRLTDDVFVPIEGEYTYTEARRVNEVR